MLFRIEYLDGTYEEFGSPGVDYDLRICLSHLDREKVRNIVRIWRIK